MASPASGAAASARSTTVRSASSSPTSRPRPGLIDARLFLPEDRAADRKHRQKTYVPKEISFQEKWRIGLDLVRSAGQELPHGWVVGDDEFGA